MKTLDSLTDYLLSLKPANRQNLYLYPAACLAVFRDLPDLAQHLVLRLLHIDISLAQTLIRSWIIKGSEEAHENAVNILRNLKIWSQSPAQGGLPGWRLNEAFCHGLQAALFGSGDADKLWELKPRLDEDKYAKDKAALDAYALERWELVLHYMTRPNTSAGNSPSSNEPQTISVFSITTLEYAKLIAREGSTISITADGFQFLLMDTASQVWYYMTKYLEIIESKSGPTVLVEYLSFLLQLSFSTLGQSYDSTPQHLSSNLREFLQNLREFGLVWQRRRKEGRFYPTRLVINLFSGLRDKKSDVCKNGFVIVETNYRVYAYTESPLQIALLALFTEMHYMFPNFCIGMLTRDSVRSALKSGITAAQITNFLTINAHPSIVGKPGQSVVPVTIIDQIRLWEIERNRFIFKSGVLYSQFLSQADFDLLRNYAKEHSHLVWENPSKRVMVVSTEGHDAVRLFWKRHKKDSRRS